MRLGKEQAVGYVEDTEADSLPAQELTVTKSDEMPPATATEPSLTAS
jgi:hypothetical protein